MAFTGSLRPYQEQPVADMVDRGSWLLSADVGCLTGDTEVTVNRFGKSYRLRLDELVARYQEGPVWGRSRRRLASRRYDDGHTMVRCMKSDGRVGLAPLVGVLDSGVKSVVRMSLSDGRSVVLTAKHEVMTPEGKTPASSLAEGSVVLVDSWRGRPDHWGEYRANKRGVEGGRRRGESSRTEDGRYVDQDGYVLVYGVKTGAWVYEHRLVMERELGRRLLSSEHVHHRNHVRTDNRVENLELVDASQHARLHADRDHLPGVVPDRAVVVSVEDAGERHVYDLSIDDPAHTWIGNGVVVGNTGKTAITIAAVEELAEEFGDGFCGVVVCPGGLKEQWAHQIAAFTCEVCCGRDVTDPGHPQHDAAHEHVGASTVGLIDGAADKRMAQYEAVLARRPRYVVVGYEQVVSDHNMVCELPQMFVVADEVTTIKSPMAGKTGAFRSAFSEAPFRFGLTGTPMENGKPEELFQIMVWVDDTVFGRADLFDKTFCKRNAWGGVREYMNLPLFFEMLSECASSISVDDPEVSQYMPAMSTPTRVLVELDEETARVYDLMSRDLLAELADAAKKSRSGFDLMAHYAGGSSDAETQGKIMSKIACMRMLMAHPDQLIESAQEHVAARAVKDADPEAWPKVKKERRANGRTSVFYVDRPLPGSAYAAELLANGELDGLDETPKLDEVQFDLDDMLAGRCECCSDLYGAQRTNKVVVFSYHKRALRVLEQRYGSDIAARYDGSMTLKARNAQKRRFQQDPTCRLFLTSDAGGYGVDLPQANHLLNLDVPFTAGRVTQRNARVRRANLDYHDLVHVRDYLIDGSLEVFYADITAGKQRVVDAVTRGRGADKSGKLKITASSLGEFLRTHGV